MSCTESTDTRRTPGDTHDTRSRFSVSIHDARVSVVTELGGSRSVRRRDALRYLCDDTDTQRSVSSSRPASRTLAPPAWLKNSMHPAPLCKSQLSLHEAAQLQPRPSPLPPPHMPASPRLSQSPQLRSVYRFACLARSPARGELQGRRPGEPSRLRPGEPSRSAMPPAGRVGG